MANYASIQGRSRFGYAKAGSILGPPQQHYRPSGPLYPVDPSNLMGEMLGYFTTDAGVKFAKPPNWKDPIRFGAFDATYLAIGDYLIDPSGLTHFVSGLPPNEAISAVECNRVLSFQRQSTNAQAGTASGGGVRDYGNRTPGPVPIPVLPGDTLLTGWPASCLLGTKGESAPASGRLPDDTRAPWWSIKMPALAGGPILNVTDIATDEIGRRYVVSAAELTARGWNITAQQAVV